MKWLICFNWGFYPFKQRVWCPGVPTSPSRFLIASLRAFINRKKQHGGASLAEFSFWSNGDIHDVQVEVHITDAACTIYEYIHSVYIYCLYIRLNVGIYSLHETCRIIPISPHVPAMLSKFTRLVPHQIAIFCFRKALFLMDVAPSWSWGLNLRQWGNSHLLLSRIPGTLWLDASPNGRHGRSWSFPTRWVLLNKTFSDPVLAMRI